MVGLSVPELVLIGGIALVVFGPSKLPEVGGAVGKALREFKNAMKDPEPEQKILAVNPQETPKSVDAASQQPKENDTAH
jgi:sec-independent protein translocase protein TatA